MPNRQYARVKSYVYLQNKKGEINYEKSKKVFITITNSGFSIIYCTITK